VHIVQQTDDLWIPAFQTASQLAKLHLGLYRHSGLDPESSAASCPYVSGCRIKSGMTGRIFALFLITTQSASRE
jgi:hypothetical protein